MCQIQTNMNEFQLKYEKEIAINNEKYENTMKELEKNKLNIENSLKQNLETLSKCKSIEDFNSFSQAGQLKKEKNDIIMNENILQSYSQLTEQQLSSLSNNQNTK